MTRALMVSRTQTGKISMNWNRMKRIALIIIGVIIVAACSGQEVLKRNLELRKTTPVLNLNGTGATIQFYNGDITLSHSSDQLTLSGGTLLLPGNDILLNGSLGSTSIRVTKGWFNDAEFSHLPTVLGATFKSALSLTASDVGLGNVTNESKATMFTSPTFTGHPTIEGVTSTGATGTGGFVFSASPTFTGTVTTAAFNVGGTTLAVDSISKLSTDHYAIYDGADTLPPYTPDAYTDDPYDIFPEIHAFAGDTSNYATPGKIGDLFIDTSASKVYVSVSTSRGGWVILNILFLVFYFRRRKK